MNNTAADRYYGYIDPNPLGIPTKQALDLVNSPPHYNAGRIETIDYILQVCKNYRGEEAALVANVIKYISRAPLKGEMPNDLKKAQWYLNKLVENLPN
jgi:hypothetical protein